MIRPHQPARHVRHHQADKGNRADYGGRAAAQHGDGKQARQLRTRHAVAEGGRGVTAEAQAVQRPA